MLDIRQTFKQDSIALMNSRVLCVIMGGGRGTRLHPLTQERCKPAVPLAGKYRLADIPISNCLNSGYNQIHVLTQFNTASLHNHIQATYQFDPFGGGFVEILSAEQTESGATWYQGTADAVRQNLIHFHAQEEDLFLILSGDQLYRMDFRHIIYHHHSTGADVTVSAKPVPKSEVAGLGVMRVNDDFSIAEFVEKPTDPAIIDQLTISDKLRGELENPQEGTDYCLASMGIYVFRAKVLMDALESEATDFGKEVIPGLLGRAHLSSFIFDTYWEDIGTIRSFFEANLALTDPVPPFNFYDGDNPIYTRSRFLPASKINGCHMERVILAGGSIVSDAQIKRSVVGVRSKVREHSRLENTVMMGGDYFESPADVERNRELNRPDIGIGRNCDIRDAIIDKNARIGNDVKLSPEGKKDLFERGDVSVRDGIVIVSKNGIVPDGFEF